MNLQEKEVEYTSKNTYVTLNQCTDKTEYVWVVFHGMGFLSRFFLKNFEVLEPERHYIIAPQAPSKYYLTSQFKHVGASWLTKEHTDKEIKNLISYLDGIMAVETWDKNKKLVVFGFSQGVSIALRWVAHRQIACDHLIIYAGGIPNELKPEQLIHLKEHCKTTIIMGDQDEYLTEERRSIEKKKIEALFQDGVEIRTFNGGHEIKKEIIKNLL